MCAAKKKTRLQNKEYLKHSARSARTPENQRFAGQPWGPRFELCTGWLACLLIIVAPLVFNSQLRNFADLPQRTFIQAAVALFCLLGLAHAAVVRNLELPRNICCCALAAFACWAFLSVLWSLNPYDALYAAVHWSVCALAAFGLVAWMKTDVWLGRFAGSIVVSGLIVSAVALSQQFLGLQSIPSRGPSAAFGNLNVLAEFLSMTIVVSVFAAWFVRRRLLLSALCWLAVGLELLALYYTHCRAAWLAIGCALLWSAVLFFKRYTGWKVFVPVAALVLCVGAYAGFSLVTKPALKRQLDGSAHYRLIIWNNTFELFKQKPVLGHGAGSFPYMYGAVINTVQMDSSFGKDIQVKRAHNDFLQTAAELGLPGFFLLVAFVGGVLVMALRLMSAHRTGFEFFIVLAASGALVVVMVTGCFGFPLQRSLMPLLAFMGAGMVVALYCRQRKAFFHMSRRGAFIAAALGLAVAGASLLHFNLGLIESDGYFKRAILMEKRGNNVKALEFALQAAAARPGRMDVLTTAGRAYIATGRIDEGLTALQTVTARQPYNLNALFFLGAGYANAGRSKEALDTFRRVLEIKPDFAEARKVVSRLKAHGRVKVNLK